MLVLFGAEKTSQEDEGAAQPSDKGRPLSLAVSDSKPFLFEPPDGFEMKVSASINLVRASKPLRRIVVQSTKRNQYGAQNVE